MACSLVPLAYLSLSTLAAASLSLTHMRPIIPTNTITIPPNVTASLSKACELSIGDQSLLNLFFRRWTELPRNFNVPTRTGVPNEYKLSARAEQRERILNASLLHFAGDRKPWSNRSAVRSTPAASGASRVHRATTSAAHAAAPLPLAAQLWLHTCGSIIGEPEAEERVF